MSQIDGKALALKKEAILREKIEGENPAKKPRVVDFCTFSQPGAEVYLNLKVKKAESLGIEFTLVDITNYSIEEFKSEINKANTDSNITGMMIQVPLPENLYPYQGELINLINPQKDVDGLKINGPFTSATGVAVLELLESININFMEKVFAVVGSEGVEGQAIVQLLEEKKAKVLEIDRKHPNYSLEDIKKADVVISATGQEELISADLIKEGAILIDVGLGEFSEDCYEKASFYTPKVGGVGPMTIICLMENIIKTVSF
jgi:methylenetetrahydrofolate dehydrogenase (NADP+) / methenyltetrahydrofolate cyclohydrolase